MPLAARNGKIDAADDLRAGEVLADPRQFESGRDHDRAPVRAAAIASFQACVAIGQTICVSKAPAATSAPQ